MAIRGTADRIVMYLVNRPNLTYPLIFSDFNNTARFSFSVWVKVLDTSTPDAVIVYEGETGSKLVLAHDGTNWYFHARKDAVAIYAAQYLGVVQVGRWTLFCFTKVNTALGVWMGVELGNPPDTESAVAVNMVMYAETPDFSFTFDHLALVVRNNVAVCNLKFWNNGSDGPTLQNLANQWHDWNSPHYVWASPLRTTGDIASIHNPYTSPEWSLGHEFAFITPSADSLRNEFPDPAYLAKYEPCPTWLYPLHGPTEPLAVTANPGTTPLVITDYIGEEFWEFIDKGSLPRSPFVSITYYAWPFTTGAGKPTDASWGYFKDENGVGGGSKDITNMFTPDDTGVPAPVAVNYTNIFAWQFGGFFTWNPIAPQQPTAQANLGWPYLYVVYIGYPTGVAALPVEDLTGLFVINKGGIPIDRYNRGIELKIPDPTIRTAFIGE